MVKPILQNHGVNLIPSQVKTLLKGGSIIIKPSQLTEAGDHALALLPTNHKKLISSFLKGKVFKLTLKPAEDIMNQITGGSLLDDMRNAFDPGKNGATQFFQGAVPVLKTIAKTGISTALPALGAAGAGALAIESGPGAMLAGAAGGMAGGLAADLINSQIGDGIGGKRKRGRPKKKGKGFFQALHSVGISRDQFMGVAKTVGKKVANTSADIIGKIVAEKTKNPTAGKILSASLKAGANKVIDTESVHQGANASLDVAKTEGVVLAKKEVKKIIKQKIKDPVLQEQAIKVVDQIQPQPFVHGGAVINPMRIPVPCKSGGCIQLGSPHALVNAPQMSTFHSMVNQNGGCNPLRGGCIHGGAMMFDPRTNTWHGVGSDDPNSHMHSIASPAIHGAGLADQKFSIRRAVDAGREVGGIFGAGVLDDEFSVNDVKNAGRDFGHMFGKGLYPVGGSGLYPSGYRRAAGLY